MDKPVLGLKWVGEGNEEETVDTEDRLFNNKNIKIYKKRRAKPGTFFSLCHLLDTVPSDQ